MEFKFEDVVKEVNKFVKLDNIGENIIIGLKSIELEGFLLQPSDFMDLIYLFSSVIKGDYRVDPKTVAWTVLGIVYVIIPGDFIPDFLGPFGYADDVAVVKFVCECIKEELKNYRKTAAYKNNMEHAFDLGYLFPLDKFGEFFTTVFKGIRSIFQTFFPTEGVIVIENMELVQYDIEKDYNISGYQDETIDFFPGDLDEVVYVFNKLLYESGGKCVIKHEDIFKRIVLPTNKTYELIRKVLDNSEQYYDFYLFKNVEKAITSWFNTIEYRFSYEIINLKENYFTMEKPKINSYKGTEINVYNIIYRATPEYINWRSMYEVIDILREAKSHSRLTVNYLVMLADKKNTYQISYNFLSKEVRVSTFNSCDLFFERELEELIRKQYNILTTITS